MSGKKRENSGGCQDSHLLEKQVTEYILEQGMIREGDHIIAGVSGGADSVCLLLLLCRLRPLWRITVTAVHVHHGVRQEGADRDARYTRELCARLDVPCRVYREDVPALAAERKISVEEAGRIARYSIFRRVMEEEGAAAVAVAHHRDDSAETFLWNLARGSGLKGLSGIEPVKNGIIRPLLCCGRQEILDYLAFRGVDYCQDETNAMTVYTRNQIRHEILPALERLNSGAADHILEAAELIGEACRWIEEAEDQFLERWGRLEEGELSLPAEKLKGERKLMRMGLYRRGLERAGCSLRDVGRRHLELADRLLEQGHGAAVQLPGGARIFCRYGELVLTGQRKGEEASGLLCQVSHFPFQWEVPAGFRPGGVMEFQLLPAGTVPELEKNQEKMYTKWFDYDRIKNRLSVRTRKPGDYIEIMPGHRKKTVKSFMIDQKIPREHRDRLLLVADGSHVLWIIGFRDSAGCRISGETNHILQITVREGTQE